MSSTPKSLNDIAWEQLFSKYKILHEIESEGKFIISASQIKEFREPRLMAKFDHSINLPQIFTENQLAILPITRGDYIISHFEAYHRFESCDTAVERVSLPEYIQSLNSNNVPSEAIALNCGIASGIIADFIEDEGLLATVSGRMGSGCFSFNILNSKDHTLYLINVDNSQIEIDAAYEGVHGLALFEAKRDLSDDFLIRQLYYPYRVWKERITKTVRPLFLVYSNGIYHLYEYKFQNPDNYNSLILIKQKNYSIEDTSITVADIQNILKTVKYSSEPDIPFPQADSFERVINICELLSGKELSRGDVTEQYDFDVRQTNYYTDAARYLGLLEKQKNKECPSYKLSELGKIILNLNYRQRQLSLCKLILSHRAFSDTLNKYFSIGIMPSTDDIVYVMRSANLYKVGSDSTFKRRSSTIKGWINWILSLINE